MLLVIVDEHRRHLFDGADVDTGKLLRMAARTAVELTTDALHSHHRPTCFSHDAVRRAHNALIAVHMLLVALPLHPVENEGTRNVLLEGGRPRRRQLPDMAVREA